jgi:hypothetical protein
MRHFSLFLMFWSVAVFAAHSQTAHAPGRRLPLLSGAILDINKTPIARAQVQLTGKSGLFKSETKLDGSYSLRIPDGEYSLVITAKGFCTHMQSLSMTPKEISQSRDFVLMECSDCPPMDIDFVEPRVEIDGPPPSVLDPSKLPSMKYQVEDFRGGRMPPKSKQSILFGRRDESGDSVEYVGLLCPGHEKLPVFMFDGGNIKADKFSYSKESHILRGEGSVVLVDERGVMRGRVVEIQLSQKSARVLFIE